MAKKTTVKKPRRRLKKTVRRSLAAVLMITAIAVAAIPVPENLAVNPQADTDNVVSPVAYVPADEAGVLPTPPENKYVLPYTGDVTLPSGGAITTKEELREYVLAPDVKAGKVQATEIVTTAGSSKYLTWQFIYKETGTNRGKVLNYNDEFQTPLVDLGLQPNTYFFVYKNAYDAYFDNPEQLITTETLGENDDKTLQLLDMDNLGRTAHKDGDGNTTYTYADFYPTQPISYTYNNYDSSTGRITLEAKYQRFFEYEDFKRDYENTTASFQSFWDEIDRLQNSDDAADRAKAQSMLTAMDDPRLDPLVKRPNELGENGRKKFFCEHNGVLRDTGYELELVSDDRLDAPAGTSVYVAYGGDITQAPDYKEVDGYLVKEDPTILNSIAYRAFANVHNVGQIKIDAKVSTIEQSAFEGANISSVSLGNVEVIGARAFYNCINLSSVSFPDPAKTNSIGVEAFAGAGISAKLEFPSYLTSIGYGAFAKCGKLSEVQFANGTGCSVGKFAFYDDLQLTNVDFSETTITNIGDAAFAIASPSGDAMTEFHFPSKELQNMSDYILANRQGLKKVYIENYKKRIPDNTFYNCFGLEMVKFSDNCGAATFGENLFKDVTEDSFCVYGPELYANREAGPRTSTWDAKRIDGKGIPYVYEKGGKKHYEMALESNGKRYRYSASEDGTLISCALITRNTGKGNIDLIIPETIGNIKINTIGPGCFDDSDLRDAIRSITIKNNSVSEIGEGVFRDLSYLRKVRIGDSVTSIGANAFYGCDKLVDVYFTKPSAGYSALSKDKIGNNAFFTTGERLTFHGDIAKDYGPFELAMEPKNQLDITGKPVNICYQSLWDSEQGAHLTVMVDPSTSTEDNKVVTLLDYPKYSDLKNLANDDELQDYCREMEEYYYYKVYDNNDNDMVRNMRTQYAYIFDAYRKGEPTATLPGGEEVPATMDELEKRYGAWINPVYCAGAWVDYLSAGEAQDDTAGGKVMDFLFKPLIAEAWTNPTPYFEAHPYDFMENYENFLTMDTAAYRAQPEYKWVTQKEFNFIQATEDIYVPEEVNSIDVKSYKDNNSNNYDKYIRNRYEANTMYESTLNDAIPGLFSGYYKDYEDDDDERETAVRGNDRVKSVVLAGVTTVPSYAFDSCEQLSRVEMPKATSVGELPFRGCENLIHLVGSDAYPAERGILYEKHIAADGSKKYRIIECLPSRGKPNSGNDELSSNVVSPANDSLIPFLCETCDTDKDGSNVIPAIAASAFEGCKYIATVNLLEAEGLKTIPKNVFKDCTKLGQVVLPGSVNKIADEAFTRTSTNGNHATVYIYGREVDIADNAFAPTGDFTIVSYEDSASKRYADRYKIDFKTLDAYRVWFYDYDGTLLVDGVTVDEGHKYTPETIPEQAKVVYEENHRPGYVFVDWLSDTGKTLDAGIKNDMTVYVAQYKSDGTLVDGMCEVEFLDGIDGSPLGVVGEVNQNYKYYLYPGESFMSKGWTEPKWNDHTLEGYKFKEWSNSWTINTEFQSSMTIIALYEATSTSGGSTNTSGGSTNTSRNTTSSNSGSNTSRNSTSSTSSSSTSSSSTSSSSTSSSSTTSGSASEKALYTVTVINGNGSGTYAQGTTVVISANEPAAGMTFQKWTTESNGVTLASVSLPATTFTMPAGNVTVTANYVAATAANTATPTSTGGNSGGGSTRVDITKPGISNKDLATANANGTTDNFIVKITETDEATRAVADALANKYGSLDNILYYAMDISLWDSTGTYQLSGDQLNGITVDITIPIPDALVAYGGNNMAGAVVNGNQLENLNENFTTINGVPCIKFTASHFSPYTVYVDTGNLTEGMLDTTPKTGDPIHPKWFLSIGLACLSIILFMKKDKSAKVKTA